MKGKLHGYPNIYALGHAALTDLFDGPVLVEEKVDGSQFTFARVDGELVCRSKGKDQSPGVTDKMFEPAIEEIQGLDLHDGWAYRAEYLQKPKHNVIAYDRVPRHHLVIFDINTGDEVYLSYADKEAEAARLGLEVVPSKAAGIIASWEDLQPYLDHYSFLGGTKVEGIVVKNYARFGRDKKALMGKFVSEAFKERNSKEWVAANPTTHDIIIQVTDSLRTEARWEKAIQHLRDNGELAGSPQDIGPLIKEIRADILKEETEYIRDRLFRYAWPQIERKVVAGFPEWYKERLAKAQFGDDTQND